MPPPRKADVVRVCGVLGDLELGENEIVNLYRHPVLDTGLQGLSKGDDIAIADRASLVRNDGLSPTPNCTSHKRYSIVCSAESSLGRGQEHCSPLPLGEGAVARAKRATNAGEGEKFAKQTEMNLFTYLPIHLFTSKKVAFTLAEVLITLGIIGVVAAMTMPVLIQNHRKSVVETRLKHFYSVINQAITLAEVQHGDKATWQLEDADDFWNNYLEPHIKYLKVDDADYQGGAKKSVYLPNGSAFAFNVYSNSGGNTNGAHFMFYPDAKKASDVYGVRAFMFGFWPNGGYYNESTGSYNKNSFKYHQNKGVEPYTANWNGDVQVLYNSSSLGCNKESRQRFYCTAIIQHNGWKIPDDYPFRF